MSKTPITDDNEYNAASQSDIDAGMPHRMVVPSSVAKELEELLIMSNKAHSEMYEKVLEYMQVCSVAKTVIETLRRRLPTIRRYGAYYAPEIADDLDYDIRQWDAANKKLKGKK